MAPGRISRVERRRSVRNLGESRIKCSVRGPRGRTGPDTQEAHGGELALETATAPRDVVRDRAHCPRGARKRSAARVRRTHGRRDPPLDRARRRPPLPRSARRGHAPEGEARVRGRLRRRAREEGRPRPSAHADGPRPGGQLPRHEDLQRRRGPRPGGRRRHVPGRGERRDRRRRLRARARGGALAGRGRRRGHRHGRPRGRPRGRAARAARPRSSPCRTGPAARWASS